MLSFSLVAEALTGLIYHRPPDENSNFAFFPTRPTTTKIEREDFDLDTEASRRGI